MHIRTYTISCILAVLSLMLAVIMFGGVERVRAQPPEQWNDTLTLTDMPEQQVDNLNELVPADGDVIKAQAVAEVPPGTAYVVLPAAAFTSDGGDPDGFLISFDGGYFVGKVDFDACLVAPVQLPRGVTVVSLEVFAWDANVSSSELFSLRRMPLASGLGETMAVVSTPTGSPLGRGPYVDTTISYGTVSDDYTYYLTTCARQNIYVYGARIGYVSTAFLPTVIQPDDP